MQMSIVPEKVSFHLGFQTVRLFKWIWKEKGRGVDKFRGYLPQNLILFTVK